MCSTLIHFALLQSHFTLRELQQHPSQLLPTFPTLPPTPTAVTSYNSNNNSNSELYNVEKFIKRKITLHTLWRIMKTHAQNEKDRYIAASSECERERVIVWGRKVECGKRKKQKCAQKFAPHLHKKRFRKYAQHDNPTLPLLGCPPACTHTHTYTLRNALSWVETIKNMQNVSCQLTRHSTARTRTYADSVHMMKAGKGGPDVRLK